MNLLVSVNRSGDLPTRRAVITGVGPVTPIGTGRTVFWNALTGGESGVRPITRFDSAPFPVHVAGEVVDFEPSNFLSKKELRHATLFAQFAVAAARLALEDAGVTRCSEIGACFGSSIAGGGDVTTNDVPPMVEAGFKTASPWAANRVATHSSTSLVCQILGLEGPRASMASGCTTGLDVIDWACRRIDRREADVLVVGASDAPMFPVVFGLMCASGAYSAALPAPRPFDRNRSGAVVSEGGGAIVVEELDHARQRGARIYAEITGFGSAGEAADIYRPPAGTAGPEALGLALTSARLDPETIDAVFPMAPGVPALDLDDVRAIKTVLGSHAYRVPAPSIQSSLGHMISASSVLQMVAASLAVYEQQVPPTINYETADPECDLDCVPNRSRFSRINHAAVLARSMSRTCAAMTLTRQV